MQNQLENVRDLIIIATGVVGIITGIIGSAFTLYKFKLGREVEAAIQIELKIEEHKYSANNLVDVSIEIKNVGKTAAFISSNVYKQALFMVRKISCQEACSQLRWEQLEDQKLIDDVEYLDVYGSDYPDEPIIIEPNCTDNYSVFFVTDYFGPIWIRVVLIDKDKYVWMANKLFILSKF